MAAFLDDLKEKLWYPQLRCVQQGGASNFFELAVATAISLFGFHSGAALATVVGVLIEVPVMLFVVGIVNRSQHWYEARHNTKGQPL